MSSENALSGDRIQFFEGHIGLAGSESTCYGYPRGGYLMQQHIHEFAKLMVLLEDREFKFAVEIGIGSGGRLTFMRKHIKIHKTVIVDITGGYSNVEVWEDFKKEPHMEGAIVEELWEGSTLPVTHEALRKYKGMIDYSFIDGAHDYATVKNDALIIHEIAKAGCIVVFHDSVSEIKNVGRLLEELKQQGTYKEIARFEMPSPGLVVMEVLK